MSRNYLSFSYYTLLGFNKDATESSTVTKSNENPDVEAFSETSLSQNTYKEGMSRGTRDTDLTRDTEAENTAKGKTERSSGFSASDAAREKCLRKQRL